jgi:hypothetical protein
MTDSVKAYVASTYTPLYFFSQLDLCLLLSVNIIVGLTVFHYENVLSVYLTDTIGMKEDYLGYIFAIKSLVYAPMGYITPKYIYGIFTRRQLICMGIFWLALANCFIGSC